MKTHTLLPLILIFCYSCQNNKSEKQISKIDIDHFEYPPEWEPHQAVWIDINDYWYNAEAQISARLEIVKALQNHVPVKILTTTDSLTHALKTRLAAMQVDTNKITFIQNRLPNNFMRDTGPIFLSNGEQLKMANFNWKCFNKWCDETDNQRGTIDDSIAGKFQYKVKNSKINYEGGGIDVNSNTAIAIKQYAMEQNENQLTLEEIEKEILTLYGKENMIWLEGIPLIERNGLKIDNYFGQGADGHIDALVRFVNDSTLLVTTISDEDKDKSPIQKHDYDIFQGYLKQLKSLKRPNGQGYHIIEIPSPDVSLHTYAYTAKYVQGLLEQYEVADKFQPNDTIKMVPIIGYANFLITNGAVLVSEYWEDGMPDTERRKDVAMKDILQTYFPDREIIGIKAKRINWDGGGIHCSTQQEPKLK